MIKLRLIHPTSALPSGPCAPVVSGGGAVCSGAGSRRCSASVRANVGAVWGLDQWDVPALAKASPRGDDRETAFTQIQVAASALRSDHKKGLEISAVDFGRLTKTVQLSRDHK
ncbi:unnamed protein product [Pleuronectes platessa]|uniref:Uncharacterized protein n=1 Tax=Pleuronectes platessa TaxID=8262 RepID=A0A9N7YIL9_PLEPL|nr:unnamed protein product [Pleuronectes platessa]